MVTKAVTVFAGRRDNYQLPIALFEAGLLERHVSEIYFPLDHRWFKWLAAHSSLRNRFVLRNHSELPSHRVTISARSLLEYLKMILFNVDKGTAGLDQSLSLKARQVADKTESALFVSSYYAIPAFLPTPSRPRYRFLQVLQAHPVSARNIFAIELERHPQLQHLIRQTEVYAVGDARFSQLVAEYKLANGWVVPSSFAARTLRENNIAMETNGYIVPYGVNHNIFQFRDCAVPTNKPLALVYVGSIDIRKGLHYLFKALRNIGGKHFSCTIVTNSNISDSLLSLYPDIELRVVRGLKLAELKTVLHEHDVFVFPSLLDSFGHVILEAMACGLPVIATDHTCGPDVIIDGENGFIIPAQSSDAIEEKLRWCLDNRLYISAMGEQAYRRARLFTWERFRHQTIDAYKNMLSYIDR